MHNYTQWLCLIVEEWLKYIVFHTHNIVLIYFKQEKIPILKIQTTSYNIYYVNQ